MSAVNLHEPQLSELARAARDGDGRALEQLLRALSDSIYRLCLRMTGSPPDAEDATQEVLIKVATRLGGFRGDAAVSTWAHRIAVNHLLDRRKSAIEALGLDFDKFAADLLEGQQTPPADCEPVLAEEVKLGCTLAMLTCLDRQHRIAYVLGEVFDLPPALAAQIVGTTEPAHRQRLSRARRQLEAFTQSYCGMVNPRAPCRCDRRVARAVELGRVNRERPALTSADRERSQESVRQMERLHDAAALFRSHPQYRAPERIVQTLSAALSSGLLRIPD